MCVLCVYLRVVYGWDVHTIHTCVSLFVVMFPYAKFSCSSVALGLSPAVGMIGGMSVGPGYPTCQDFRLWARSLLSLLLIAFT